MEKPASQIAFEAGHALCYRRWREAELARGRGEAAVPRHGSKAQELVEIFHDRFTVLCRHSNDMNVVFLIR
jgi:hypothetical protein